MIDTDTTVDGQSIAFRQMESKLGAEGMELLDEQLSVWAELNGRALYSPLRDRLRQGNTTLPAGTLIHSVGMHSVFDERALRGIAKMGVVSGELVGVSEDSETHGCADFFRVPEGVSLRDYVEFAGSTVSVGSIRMRRGESMIKRAITFIVDPQAEGVERLTQHDGYQDPSMSEFVQTPSGRTAKDTAAILGGMPRGALAGMILPRAVVEDETKLRLVQELFADLPAYTQDGSLVLGSGSGHV